MITMKFGSMIKTDKKECIRIKGKKGESIRIYDKGRKMKV